MLQRSRPLVTAMHRGRRSRGSAHLVLGHDLALFPDRETVARFETSHDTLDRGRVGHLRVPTRSDPENDIQASGAIGIEDACSDLVMYSEYAMDELPLSSRLEQAAGCVPWSLPQT